MYIHDFSPSFVGFSRCCFSGVSLECFKLALKFWVCQHSIFVWLKSSCIFYIIFFFSNYSCRATSSSSLICLNLYALLPPSFWLHQVCFVFYCSVLSCGWFKRRGYFDLRGALTVVHVNWENSWQVDSSEKHLGDGGWLGQMGKKKL